MKILREELEFVRKSKMYIFIAVGIFLLFSILGFIFPIFEEEIMIVISEMKTMFEGLNVWQTIGLLFFNNSRTSLLAIILGFSFGIVPLILSMSNGYIIGFVSRMVTNEYSFFEMWRILPHGIFELPAVLISMGIGLRIGIEILTKPTKKNFLDNLDKALKTFVLIVVPLLIIAAIIEGLLIAYF